jgi:hypothetical protein
MKTALVSAVLTVSCAANGQPSASAPAPSTSVLAPPPSAPSAPPPSAAPVTSTKDAECRASALCKEEGRCGWDKLGYNECVATSDADCAASEGCKKEGLCRYAGACPPSVPCAGLNGARCAAK